MLLVLAGCGDSIDGHISDLMAGGAARDEAYIELLFAKRYAVPVLLDALENTEHPARGRADIADLLWKIYLRDSDPRIIDRLLNQIDDSAAPVRRAVAGGLREMGNPAILPFVLEKLEAERNEQTQLELLRAMEALDGWDANWEASASNFSVRGGGHLKPEQQKRFANVTLKIYRQSTHDSLRQQAGEFLERFAGRYVQEATQLILKADIAGAEERLLQALDLKPDSKNLLLRLGKLYYLNGQQQKGLDLLERHGLLLRLPRLSRAPTIDGDLSDPVWAEALKVDQFYKSATLMRPVPADGRTEAFLGYFNNQIYIAVKNYEETTIGLSVDYNVHDSEVWRDDCVELFFDTNMDQRSFYQLITNPLGATFDTYRGGNEEYALQWDSGFEAVARIEATFWTVEKAIPIAGFHDLQIQPGDVWGFNLVRARIGLAAEHCQWLPTYGYTHRPDFFGLLTFN